MTSYRKSTTDLYMDMMSQPDLSAYLQSNEKEFSERNTAQLLSTLMVGKGYTKAEIARRACVSAVYLHQVLAGRRQPSRNRLLCICLGMGATLEETQRLLLQAVYAQLYPKVKRDSIIIFGILHHLSVPEVNDKLFTEDEETLN